MTAHVLPASDEDPEVYFDDNGEVLAVGEDQRREVIALLGTEALRIEREISKLAEIRAKLELLMRVGDVVASDGWSYAMEKSATPARRVNTQEVEIHGEALAEFGLAMREEATVRQVFPGVSDFTKAKADLARAGLSPDQFLIGGGEPGKRLRLYRPKEER